MDDQPFRCDGDRFQRRPALRRKTQVDVLGAQMNGELLLGPDEHPHHPSAELTTLRGEMRERPVPLAGSVRDAVPRARTRIVAAGHGRHRAGRPYLREPVHRNRGDFAEDLPGARRGGVMRDGRCFNVP
ncbi:hypothetical protein GCM10010502_25140 [Kitasatospora aureofaciens]|uniref:Uncharacterized protein n=1 Tax=Kitasatospora aureofaciens TaxID=1894 RepID=A0A8H9LQK8_KITAU|nr:hypothetical protein GCM10010502_25140 [Kitasatospora aureofaciens]